MHQHQYLEDITFLVVEDNPFMRRIVMRILWAFGAKRVEEASDGGEAITAMESFQPDIIVLDWEMEPVDGIQFMKFVRDAEDSKNPFIPVIMLTGHAERHRIITARNAGVNEYLLKPVSAQALLSRVQAVIERPRQFVRTKTFFGPDRRRKDERFKGDNRRAGGAAAPRAGAEAEAMDAEMHQDEINELFNPEDGQSETEDTAAGQG
ncbi:MAG: response regulator [Hyphomicrobiales bacterium]|nr:response regulator [Hyphomicrobiales bacterium]MCP5372110.1 response regulator [Hyphomicrobiales bacterium]